MKRFIFAPLFSVLLAVTPAGASKPLVSASIMAKATRVAICEEGGWNNAHGPLYYGSVGFLDATWQMFRYKTFPARMDHASPSEQAWALSHMLAHYGMAWPDQFGCSGSY